MYWYPIEDDNLSEYILFLIIFYWMLLEKEGREIQC